MKKLNIPVLRFPQYHDKWQNVKIGEVTNVLSGFRVHKDEWKTSGVPFFRLSDIVSHYKGEDNEKSLYFSRSISKTH